MATTIIQREIKMVRKTIKNYTTTIAVEKTVMEIEQILSKFGATNIFKMYEDGVVIGRASCRERVCIQV